MASGSAALLPGTGGGQSGQGVRWCSGSGTKVAGRAVAGLAHRRRVVAVSELPHYAAAPIPHNFPRRDP